MEDVVVLVNKNGLDSSEKKYIDDNLNNILPIKKITSFFNNENFLFTKYTPSTSSVNTIVESYNGKQYHFTSMNCGYGGGPNNLYRILIDRFVKQDDKSKYRINDSIIWNPHIEIDFDRDCDYLWISQKVDEKLTYFPKSKLDICSLRDKIYGVIRITNTSADILTITKVIIKGRKPIALNHPVRLEENEEYLVVFCKDENLVKLIVDIRSNQHTIICEAPRNCIIK